MSDLTPRVPTRPLLWPDMLLDLADFLADAQQPVYIVGGAVRDAYLGFPLHDIDLVTPRGASALARRIADFLKGDIYVMDAERDVARVFTQTPDGPLGIDIAAYRADDLLGDLTARDFTLNAMAVDLRDLAHLIDPLNGEEDLKRKFLQRCAPDSISSDPVRGLRAVRQSIQLNAHIEKLTVSDIRANAGRLYETSPERVRDEFMKILAGPRPYTAVRILLTLGLLTPVLPAADLSAEPRDAMLKAMEGLAGIQSVISPRRTDNTAAAFGLGAFVVALDRFRREFQAHLAVEWPNERKHAALLYLAIALRAAVSAGQPVAAEDVAEHLRLSNPERARLVALLRPSPAFITDESTLDVLAQHRYWHAFGVSGIDMLLVTLAEYIAAHGVEIEQDDWVRVLERARILLETYFTRHAEIVAPKPFIDGNTLMAALKIRPGPVIGRLLDHLREQQVIGAVTDADSALAAARTFLEK